MLLVVYLVKVHGGDVARIVAADSVWMPMRVGFSHSFLLWLCGYLRVFRVLCLARVAVFSLDAVTRLSRASGGLVTVLRLCSQFGQVFLANLGVALRQGQYLPFLNQLVGLLLG